MEGLATLVLGAFTGETLSVGRNIAKIVSRQTGSKRWARMIEKLKKAQLYLKKHVKYLQAVAMRRILYGERRFFSLPLFTHIHIFTL